MSGRKVFGYTIYDLEFGLVGAVDTQLGGRECGRQIGEQLQMNPEAVKSAQYRAFEKIRAGYEAKGVVFFALDPSGKKQVPLGKLEKAKTIALLDDDLHVEPYQRPYVGRERRVRRWPVLTLNLFCWQVLVFAADATVNGNDRDFSVTFNNLTPQTDYTFVVEFLDGGNNVGYIAAYRAAEVAIAKVKTMCAMGAPFTLHA